MTSVEPPQDLPAGTRLQMRLTTGISSRTARPGDPVGAVVRVDVPVGERVIPAGSVVRGVVVDVAAFEWRRPQAVLRLDFRELSVAGPVGGLKAAVPLRSKIVAVDNARESVDADGRILGIAPPERPASAEDSILGAALTPELYVLESAEYRIREAERPDIIFAAGVDLEIETLLPTANVPMAAPVIPPPVEGALAPFVATLPTRAAAGSPQRPADVINLLLIGSETAVAGAFRDAGWTTAVALSLRADIRTVIAVAGNAGYQLGPVSQQWLDGRPPAMVFQKQNDTFAKRHHVRIWAWPEPLQGRPVWIAAATHDVGVKFVRAERTFTHAIDARIDLERQLIVDDLRFAGAVAALSSIERPALPRRLQNATLDVMETDGRIAAVALRR